jgi:alanyl-tRNA synthetase
MPEEMLLEFYDSHGLMPDEVKEVGARNGIEVKVPQNFFGLIAGRKMETQQPVETDVEHEMKGRTVGLPRTRTLYYEDPYMTRFKARVLALFNDGSFALDETCFYPEGGGQPADLGSVTFDGERRRIVNVQKVGNVILHFVEGKGPSVGVTVNGEIDWDRRISLMRHHTATHILMGSIRRVLGEHAWQSGAQKEVDKARLDISHYDKLSRQEIEKIESLANSAVLRNMSVETMWMPREKAEQMYGFRLYQGGVVPGREIRVVKTEDWEVEACGGTHCRTTGELGLIKIVRVERVQDGVERLIFVAGLSALEFAQGKDRTVEELSAMIQKPADQVVRTVRELIDDHHRLRKELEEIRRKAANAEAARLLKKARKIGPVRLVVCSKAGGTEEEIIMLADLLAKEDGQAVAVIFLVKERVRLIVSAGKSAIKSGIDAGKIAKELATIVGGSGGGKPYFGQGGGTEVGKARKALEAVERLVAGLAKPK